MARVKFLLISLLLLCNIACAQAWQHLATGIDYQALHVHSINPWARIHVFKVNLKENQLSLAMARELSRKTSSVSQLAHYSKALIAINGGFFSTDYKPLGLRISQGKKHNKHRKISWWGVFYTRNKRPYLVAQKHFRHDKRIDFAIQGGPRLLVNGRIPKLKGGRDERTALGITPNNEVIIIVTNSAPMTTSELAKVFKKLGCRYALNLDGGSSSQLYAHIGSFKLNVSGYSSVTDAVVVKPRG